MNERDFLRLTYPRVSDIIGKQNLEEFKTVPLEILVKASERGTKVHDYCAAYVNGLWMGEIEEEYLPYVIAFQEWADTNIETLLHTNTRLYDDENKFTGEFDMIAKLKNSQKIALLDIKTSANVSKTWPIQLAAYKNLCDLNGYTANTCINLHLKKIKNTQKQEKESDSQSSPFQVKTIAIEYENVIPYQGIFSSALQCYDYFHRQGGF